MHTFILILGGVLALAGAGFVFAKLYSDQNGCLSVFLSVVVMVAVMAMFAVIADRFAEPLTSDQKEHARWKSREKYTKDRDFYIEQMNKEMAKRNTDAALIWAEKAKAAQEKIDQK